MTIDESKPKVRDEFLADLIREFGPQHGTELYQSRSVTKRELTKFLELLRKFKIASTVPIGVANRTQNAFYGMQRPHAAAEK